MEKGRVSSRKCLKEFTKSLIYLDIWIEKIDIEFVKDMIILNVKCDKSKILSVINIQILHKKILK